MLKLAGYQSEQTEQTEQTEGAIRTSKAAREGCVKVVRCPLAGNCEIGTRVCKGY